MTHSALTAHREKRRAWPFVSFRCPDPDERTLLRYAARAAGLSMTEFVRQAMAERLARTLVEYA